MLVSKAIANKLKTNTLYNTITLHSPDGSFEDITGESIVLDSFSLEQEITEKELKFGGCIASEMSVKLIDYDCSVLIGKTVQVIIKATYLEDELYPSDDLYPSKTLILPAETGTVECPIFYGKIQSAQRDKKQRNITEITAYDAFYDMSKVDLKEWFKGYVSYTTVGINKFKSFFDTIYGFGVDCGLTGCQTAVKVNIFDLCVNFTLAYVKSAIKKVTLLDLFNAYAELTLSFAVIGADGYLSFKTLSANTKVDTITSYRDLSFEDFETDSIGGYKTEYAVEEVYQKVPHKNLSWYISDNILMKSRTQADDIVNKYDTKNLFGNVYKYRPTKIKLFSYWWIEVGDKYTIQTPFADLPTIETFAFNKKMSGFTTTLTSKGEKRLGKEVKDIG